MSQYASAAGAPIQGIGDILQAQGKAGVLDQQAQIQTNNAAMARRAAIADADRQSVLSGNKIGQQMASFGASGVDVNTSGSVLSVLGASASNAELDRQNILHGGDVRAINFQNQASLDTAAAGNALKSGYFNAAGAILGGAFKMGSYYSGGAGGATDSMSDNSSYGGSNTFGGDDYSSQLGSTDSASAVLGM